MFSNLVQLELTDALPCNGKSCTAIFNGEDPTPPLPAQGSVLKMVSLSEPH